MSTEPRQAGTIESYEGRGVWVPEGLTAREVMVGAAILEKELDAPPYSARVVASMLLEAVRQGAGETFRPVALSRETERQTGPAAPC